MKPNIIRRNTTSELVIEKILDMIKDGKLEVGDRLPSVQELQQIFGVGRSSVREAVRGLSVLGYLEILPGKGTFVRKTSMPAALSDESLKEVLDSDPIFDIMEARDCLESKSAQLAAERADPAQIEKMKRAVTRMKEPNASLEAINRADLEFHLLLAEASGNGVIHEIMKLLIQKMEAFADKFWATLPSARNRVISTADQVITSISKGDGQRASESIKDHLELVTEQLKTVISESAFKSGKNI
ncbi:MAG: FadR family transcriptional regulator [Deltaproteobacteria bacterium]|nr:FadR family transcriptional regulator [Deltaproteobacteria bacterium]MBW2082932.1 FadR family transcriptional regulator [Deltaproteobacteria bacterium]HDM09984.1 FadR family transcriptional regulator [Desulfobacteraceae bacterium]